MHTATTIPQTHHTSKPSRAGVYAVLAAFAIVWPMLVNEGARELLLFLALSGGALGLSGYVCVKLVRRADTLGRALFAAVGTVVTTVPICCAAFITWLIAMGGIC